MHAPAPTTTNPPVVQPVVVVEQPTLWSSLTSYFSQMDSVFRPVSDAFGELRRIRKTLDLPNLGSVE